jgi:hypothetical protein
MVSFESLPGFLETGMAAHARGGIVLLALTLVTFVVCAGRGAHAQAPPELTRRIGDYVGRFIAGFSNVVAQEEFEFRRPRKSVRSEFLLVNYPGVEDELLTFRDVTHVDGKPLDGRQERLAGLFLEPTFETIRRAQDINLNAGEHVPPVLNPLMAVCFFQTRYLPRFRLTVNKAGREWPEGVVAVGFLETVKPTLLRTGKVSDPDAPTRGTIWVDEQTGRVLETELQVRNEGRVVTMRTRFHRDDRLQVMVPGEMQTKSPDALAVYSNFRRFTVRTDETLTKSPDQRTGETPGKPTEPATVSETPATPPEQSTDTPAKPDP